MKNKIIVFLTIFMSFILISCTNIQTEMPSDSGESFEEQDGNESSSKDSNESKNREKLETSEELLEMEEKMVKLVNKERSENNLSELELDEDLRNVARIKSKDIAENNYFSHTSPTYGSPFEMMKEFGVDFIQAAENLAGDQSVESAHEGLMNSEGHRKNILTDGITHIGIGIKEDAKYGYIFTQMFIRKP